MNFEEVRGIQRKEQNSSRMVQVGDSFYKELADFVKQSTDSYKGNQDPVQFRDLDNVVKLARRAFDAREQKLVMSAIRSVRTGEDGSENMTPEEKAAYCTIVASIASHRRFFNGVLLGDYPLEMAPKTPKEAPKLINEDINNISLVRIRKPIPRFVGADSREYGPFEANDVVKLPKAEAGLLKGQGLAETV